jgi:anti-sigma B factor antagonist
MDRLIIEEEYAGEIVVLKLRGLIDSGTSQLLEDKFKNLVTAENVRVVVDLQGVDYISSAGWGIFVGEIKGIRERNGDIKLAGMTPDVREVFDLLEFNTLLQPYDSKEDAVAVFEGRQNSRLS